MARHKTTRGRASLTNSPVAPGPSTTSEETVLASADERHQSPQPTLDDIAQAAYGRYVARGRGDGHDLDDWIEAERELQSRTRGEER